MLTPIKKENGVTASERYLSKLAEKTFLGLWSYPSVYTDEGITKNKIGKELCDLLVIFDNKVIIFSDKDIKFNENKNIDTAWSRWYRKSVLESANQLYGAEKWIREYPDRLYIDKECKSKTPIEIKHETVEIHLIAVTKNSLFPAKNFFDNIAKGSSGSFIQQYNCDDIISKSHPFTIGDINKRKNFVHILDELSLDLLMKELDTIHDFSSYLTDKVRLIRSGTLLLAHGEENLLAFHLINKFNAIPDQTYDPKQKIILQENLWDEFKNDFDYKIHHSYKLGSKLVDFWLNLLSYHILSATVGHGIELPFSTHEQAIRFLASENRMSRYVIGKAFEEKLNEVPSDARSARLVISPIYSDRLYIFLIFPTSVNISSDEYRESRRNIMEAYALVAKYKYNEIKNIIIIATEPKHSEFRSEDIMSYEFLEDLNASDRIQAQSLMKNEKILSDIQTKNKITTFTQKVGRNDPCPCGSGKKYKKCCL